MPSLRLSPVVAALACITVFASCSSDGTSGAVEASAGHGGRAGTGDLSASGDSGELGAGSGGADGGAAGEARSGAAGAAGAAGACVPADCDDGDPCTEDACDERVANGCAHTFDEGLALERQFPPRAADAQYRVVLTAGNDAFYTSSFFQTGTRNEVEISRLGRGADASELLLRLSSLTPFAGGLLSAAGLAVDNSGLGETLHALVAAKAQSGEAEVWALTRSGESGFGAPVKVGASYATAAIDDYPVERALGGIVHGAWIDADGSVSVLSPGALAAFGAPPTPASRLTLIGSETDKPVALFSDATGRVYVQASGNAPVPMLECQSAAGGVTSLSATALPERTGVWFAHWTKLAPGILNAESHAVLCSHGTCIPDASTPCADSDRNNSERNVAAELVHVQGEPPQRSYLVTVASSLSAGGSRSALAAITASLTELDSPLESGQSSKAIGKPLTLASQAGAGPDFSGPDWPAVAILQGNPVEVAVAWLAPASPDGLQPQMFLQRYRMCLPRR